MGDYRELFAYQKGFELAMDIFIITKSFPRGEMYGLTDQIRRASRSVCANLAEAYRRRRYRQHFIAKLNDSESENAETQVWLEFAFASGYLVQEQYESLSLKNEEVGKLLYYMINNPEKFMSDIGFRKFK